MVDEIEQPRYHRGRFHVAHSIEALYNGIRNRAAMRDDRDRRPEGDLMSDQTPEQTENDDKHRPTALRSTAASQ